MANLPTFNTRRLVLRELVASDIPAYEKHFINYEVIRYLTASVPWPYPADGVRKYVHMDILPHQGSDRWVWTICLQEEPAELIGVIELLRQASPANRGFWLGQQFWGNGYMTEAIRPVTDYAFETLGFEKLIFANAVGNERSRRIKEKSGARLVRREAAQYVDPSLTERDVFELTKQEWGSFKAL